MNPRIYRDLDSAERPHTRLWSNLSSQGKVFAALGEEVQYAKGAVIAPAGVVPRHCYYILQGRVMAFEYTVASGDRYYNFNEEGALVSEAGVLLQKAPPVSFVALTPVRAVRIPREALLERLRADPELSLDLLQSLSYKFLAAMDQVREASQCDIAWKVCNLLLTFAERYGVEYDGKLLIKEKISQQMLANLLGVNRITMVRAVKELRERGLIEQINGFYCIRDKARMQEEMSHLNDPL